MQDQSPWGSKCFWYGDVIDIFLQKRRDSGAEKRFLKGSIRRNQSEPRIIIIDKFGSYRVAHREMIPDAIHNTSQYANNRKSYIISQLSYLNNAPIITKAITV